MQEQGSRQLRRRYKRRKRVSQSILNGGRRGLFLFRCRFLWALQLALENTFSYTNYQLGPARDRNVDLSKLYRIAFDLFRAPCQKVIGCRFLQGFLNGSLKVVGVSKESPSGIRRKHAQPILRRG